MSPSPCSTHILKRPPIISNLDTYLAIAKESLAKAQEAFEAHRRPKPGGEPGYILTHDPKRTAFKHSLIAIAFAGIYLDARLYIEGVRRLGKEQFSRIERKTYETKLKAIGIKDANLLLACQAFRKSRNDLTHEKALDLTSADPCELRQAQKEAADAIAMIERISLLLDSKASGDQHA